MALNTFLLCFTRTP
uniref:Uncharacterized protein n=1 Tax=Anguilla anguilla TaxID=7936 RepID=A0A0E9U6T9_ANGAN